MEKQQKQPKVKVVRRSRAAFKGADIRMFCGVLKLKEDPMAIQKRLRDEWQ